MKGRLITLSAILGIILVAVFSFGSSMNGAISLEESVKTASSDIDGSLTKRVNKLKELAELIKHYDEHEYNTLVGVIEARGKNMSKDEVQNCLAAFSRLEERYPQLRSQENYALAMREASRCENEIQQKRSAYNAFVRDYNRYCRKFPTFWCLQLTGYEVQSFDYYKAAPSANDDKPLQLFSE